MTVLSYEGGSCSKKTLGKLQVMEVRSTERQTQAEIKTLTKFLT